MNAREIVPDICAGSALMCQRFGAWLLPGTVKAAACRLAATAVGAAFFVPLLFAARPVAAVAFTLWCAGAWLTRGTGRRRERAERAFVVLLDEAIGDRNGVLLADVLRLIHASGQLPEWKVTDVRAQCERLGIRVRDSLNVAGRGVSVGVHRDDLNEAWDVPSAAPLPAPSVTPSPGGSSAGQSETTWRATYPSEGVVCTNQVPVSGGSEQQPADDFDEHLGDALDVLRGVTR